MAVAHDNVSDTEAWQEWHDGFAFGDFGMPDAPTRSTRRFSRIRPSERRFVLGFPVRDGMGGISWIDTHPHPNTLIDWAANIRGYVPDCGVIVNTIDVERACLDLLRVGARSPSAPISKALDDEQDDQRP